jgi:hypothetical protein
MPVPKARSLKTLTLETRSDFNLKKAIRSANPEAFLLTTYVRLDHAQKIVTARTDRIPA